MEKKLLGKIISLLVVVAGSIPGIVTLVSTAEGPFQLPESPFWQRLLVGLFSIAAVCFVSFPFVKFLFKRLFNVNKSVLKNSLWIGLITVIGVIVAVIVGWEFNWLLPKAAGWGNVTSIEWIQFILHVPLFAAIYSVVPAFVLGLICGGGSYIYLKKKARKVM